LAIIGLLMAVTSIGLTRYSTSLTYIYTVDKVMNDIRYTQQLAMNSYGATRIEFNAGKNQYKIIKGPWTIKEESISNKFRFTGKSYFSFISKGYADIGGSGTLMIEGIRNPKKIIVSSRGRIRLEN
jgi:hypothetical protein